MVVDYEPKPDPLASLPNAKVLSNANGIYDVTLTVVDVKHGQYGINNFYKVRTFA